MRRVHVFISGQVQGVTFRASTRAKAEALGVDGWVKNLDDGRVEAVFEAEDDEIESMIQFCHRGPEPADVEDVEATYEKPEGLDGFEIRY